jgi:hypothetical protein
MKIWFQCKIKYQKEEENGKMKNVSETYLVDAVSYTEAEARIYQELGSIIRGEFEVTAITKSRFVDIFHYDDNDVWYKCKVTYVVADENSGKEKKITNMMLVTAANVKEAYERIHESLSTMLVPFEVPDISMSPIVEIFPYVSDEDKEQVIPENLRPLSEVEAEERGIVRPIPPSPAEVETNEIEEQLNEPEEDLEEEISAEER